MPELIEMPKLSDTMETGTLINWLKKEGDNVSSGDMIAEVETDKATMEVECFADGVLIKQYVKEGNSVPVGSPICAIGEKGEAAPEVESAAAPTPATEATPAEEKAAPTPHAKETPTPAPVAEPATTTIDSSDGGRIVASPLAKRIAADKGISLANIKGSGPAGRIVKEDVLAAVASGGSSSTVKASDAPAGEFSYAEIIPTKKIPVTNMRGAIARRLTESKTTIPHFYLEIEVDSAPLSAMRKRINDKLATIDPSQGGIKVSVNDIILKASTEALRRVPAVNASWAGDHVMQNGSVHLAFGVAIDDGLVTPVIRDAQAKTLRQIASEAKELIGKARNKKLKPDEMSGSTFTVTNLGMFGIKNFFGVINPPNAAILSVSAAVKQPVINDAGEIVAGERMSVGFSGDHRVVDGATAAFYLNALKNILETPETILV